MNTCKKTIKSDKVFIDFGIDFNDLNYPIFKIILTFCPEVFGMIFVIICKVNNFYNCNGHINYYSEKIKLFNSKIKDDNNNNSNNNNNNTTNNNINNTNNNSNNADKSDNNNSYCKFYFWTSIFFISFLACISISFLTLIYCGNYFT